MARLDPLKRFSARKIGSGKLFSPGSFSSRQRYGLAGALRRFKNTGRHSYAQNLSKQDLKTFHGLIGDEMAKTSIHSGGLSYRARKRIMGKAEKLMRQGKISGADKADLRNIVETMSPYRLEANGQPADPRQRAVNFDGNNRIVEQDTQEQATVSPEVPEHAPADDIELSNLRDEIDELGKDEDEHDDQDQAFVDPEVTQDASADDVDFSQLRRDIEALGEENEDDEDEKEGEVELPDMSKIKDIHF